jgi:hypothetical protein
LGLGRVRVKVGVKVRVRVKVRVKGRVRVRIRVSLMSELGLGLWCNRTGMSGKLLVSVVEATSGTTGGAKRLRFSQSTP